MIEMISPTVNIDGKTYTPESWEWMLAFAIVGCKWAIDEVTKPKFEIEVKKSLATKQIGQLEQEKEELEKQLEITKKIIEKLKEEHCK